MNSKCTSALPALLLCICSLTLSRSSYASPIPFGGHYYDFVDADGISWEDAKNAAANSVFENVHGYLATITSTEENNFLKENYAVFSGFAGAWLGGEVNPPSMGMWTTGPEAGQLFSQGQNAVSGAYANWGGGEPNNGWNQSKAYMNVGTLFAGIKNGQWADAGKGVASSGDPVKGYFVEYSVSAVPEPESYGFLFFGLVMLGAVKWRRCDACRAKSRNYGQITSVSLFGDWTISNHARSIKRESNGGNAPSESDGIISRSLAHRSPPSHAGVVART